MLKNYQPGERTVNIVRQASLTLLVGISGAGKDTILRRLLEERGAPYHHIISHTTRPMRLNRGLMEQNGREYHFIDWQKAMTMLERQEFVEANIYSDNLYGTSALEFEQTLEEDKIGLTDVDVHGVARYVSLSPKVTPIFILPPNYDTWQRRLLARYNGMFEGHEDDIKRRMQTAREELEFALSVDYFYFVINQELDQTVATVDAIAHHGDGHDREKGRAVAAALLARL